MKIKDGYILKEVAGANIVIATGAQKMNFNGIMTFNSVGADVFNLLDGTRSVDEIAEIIAKNYDVSTEVVKADVEKLIVKMKDHGLIED